MLREVGKIYSRAFRMILQSPSRYLGLAFLYSLSSRIMLTTNKSFSNLVAIALDMIGIGIGIGTLLSMYFILIVYQSENLIEKVDVMPKIKEHFWRFIGQSVIGFSIIFLYTLPIFCLLMFAVYFDGMLLIVPVWVVITGFLVLGSVTMGQRILLDFDYSPYKSTTDGLRLLNENFRFFASVYLITFLVSMAISILQIGTGSVATGISVFSVSFFPIAKFWVNLVSIMNNPIAQLFGFVVGIVTSPLFSIIGTYAYLRCKNLPASQESIADTQILSTEN
jgi:hypothetical protein